MPRFFIDDTPTVGGSAVIDGADARHIGGALRMTAGESLTLCDGRGTDYACTVTAVEKERVTLSVDAANPSSSEPTLAVTLYMGLPKGDKMELIIQKAVELGVSERKAIAASLFHDCAKNLQIDSPLLNGFDFKAYAGVPSAVLHQFTGAYLAQTHFGVDDEEILDAIRRGYVTYVISTRDVNSFGQASDGYQIRRAAVENNVTMFTALDTVKVLLDVLEEITLSISTIDA